MSPNDNNTKLPIDVNRILSMLPHRYPFLLVDRVIAFEPHKNLTAIKNVTINEPFFQGHFPGHPVMPGVLIIEALAQASGVLTQLSEGGPSADNPVSAISHSWIRSVAPGKLMNRCSISSRRRDTADESSRVRAGPSPSQKGKPGGWPRASSTRTVPELTDNTFQEALPSWKMSPAMLSTAKSSLTVPTKVSLGSTMTR